MYVTEFWNDHACTILKLFGTIIIPSNEEYDNVEIDILCVNIFFFYTTVPNFSMNKTVTLPTRTSEKII